MARLRVRMRRSDEYLVNAVAAGDRAAFSCLLERHYDRIHGLAYRILGSRADAEDLAQDVAIALPAKLRSFRGDSRFTTWLHRVVVNASRDVMRRQASRSRAASGWGDMERGRRAEVGEAAEAREWLHAAMAALSPSLRETVALIFAEDCTQAEAAVVLGVSEGTIAWRMSEVRKTLAELAKTQEVVV